MTKIRKAVFPVAGLGTRFLPVTKASPKEMLPIVDKPLIQYAVEEAAAAGITEMIFVTGRNKRSIEDHFDKAYELESELASHGKLKLLEEVQSLLPDNLHYSYVRQSEMLGLGHAVLCAKPLVGDEPFAVVLADDLIDAEVPVLRQMIDLYDQHANSVIGVQNVPLEQTSQYGIVRPQSMGVRIHRIADMVEKPQPEHAPSTLGVVGRYIFTPEIFDYLERVTPGSGGEIQLTDAVAAMLNKHPVLAYEFRGRRYDCGSKLGYLEATVDFALKHPAIGESFSNFVMQVQAELSQQKVGTRSA
ncbi:UTP--glucose-1-phosphate uridylyltransferase GalU [Noviherbaspirillum autotrophicum]|uniref:UTP--glucose-1-phosphate uridylyltransferase n=1 Tax=Noviherbaspirillum autotrophicum TaxID=709839 RepID=A0A0C1YLJ6_9BURK|nr:UTP--glucose-1-phosphate uridylyltransferase GalU [Noviherbaspirillum autotrophicum]KIF81347.1 UTP--glucose-1-phosphate uridylyltransferase [Noviherbaspirillum autotrophicum]